MDSFSAIPIGFRDAEAEADPTIVAVHAYWSGLNGGRLPTRKAFDFMAIYQQAPHLLMAERVDPATFRFIYCGTLAAENLPLDLTGKAYGPETPRVSKVPWPKMFSATLDTPCLRFGRAPIDWPGPKFAQTLYGIFPLAGEDGSPRFALAALVFNGRR